VSGRQNAKVIEIYQRSKGASKKLQVRFINSKQSNINLSKNINAGGIDSNVFFNSREKMLPRGRGGSSRARPPRRTNNGPYRTQGSRDEGRDPNGCAQDNGEVPSTLGSRFSVSRPVRNASINQGRTTSSGDSRWQNKHHQNNPGALDHSRQRSTNQHQFNSNRLGFL